MHTKLLVWIWAQNPIFDWCESWCCHGLQDLPNIVKHCKSPGPLFLSALTEDELELLHNMMDRLDHIAAFAVEVGKILYMLPWRCC